VVQLALVHEAQVCATFVRSATSAGTEQGQGQVRDPSLAASTQRVRLVARSQLLLFAVHASCTADQEACTQLSQLR
jgi:hypothetical protein